MTAHNMAINYDLFEAADALQYIDVENHTWTTEGFINAVNALYAYGQENVGAVYCSGQGGDQGTRALINNLYGGTFTNPEHTAYTADSPENVKALELLQAMDGINFDPSINGGEEIQLFCNETLGMAFCWNVAQEKTHAAAGDVEFEIFPMAFPSNGEPKLQGGIWGFGIFDNGDPARVEAAKTFIKFMTEDNAIYTDAVTTSSYWPVRELEGIYAGDDIMTEYGMFMKYMGDYYQVTKGWAQARTEWWNMLQRIGAGGNVAEEVSVFVANANAAAGN
jgi:multiple sugar transport system substrate-binding protein